MNESDTEWELSLDRPGSAGPATLRSSALLAAVIIVSTIAVVAFRHIQLAAYPQFATFHASIVLVVDGIVAFLLFGQFAYRPLLFYAILAGAYLFSAVVVIPFLLTFPGAFKAEGVVIGAAQSSIWIWHAWHIVFPLHIMLSLLAHHHFAGQLVSARRVAPCIGVAVGAAILLALLVTGAITPAGPLRSGDGSPESAAAAGPAEPRAGTGRSAWACHRTDVFGLG